MSHVPLLMLTWPSWLEPERREDASRAKGDCTEGSWGSWGTRGPRLMLKEDWWLSEGLLPKEEALDMTEEETLDSEV